MQITLRFLTIVVLTIFTFSCDKNSLKPEDDIPPNVTITSPVSGITVKELVTITCISTDNKKVSKVELWINGEYSGVFDESEPYKLEWNTSTYENGTYTITIRSFDSSENVTDSEPIILILDNSEWFGRYWGGESEVRGNCIDITSDGGFIIVGSTWFFGDPSCEVYLIKTDSEGNEIWNKMIGGSDIDRGYFVQSTMDGGYVISGNTRSFGIENPELWLIKTDSNGNVQWDKTFGGHVRELSHNTVQQTNDGGYIITSTTDSFGNGDYDAWLIKTDSNGNVQWDKTFGSDDHDYAHSVLQTTEGGYAVLGRTNSGNSDSQTWLIKTDSNGNISWNKTIESGGRLFQETSDSGFIITGRQNGETALIKTDSNGVVEWENTYEGDDPNAIQQTTDGGYVIAGGYYNVDNWDVHILKTDSNGNEEWNHHYGLDGNDWAESVKQLSNGGYIIVGSTSSFESGYFGDDAQILLLKFTSDGSIDFFGD